MDSRLDQMRSRSARQRNELDELRTRLEEKERRIEALLEKLQSAGSADELREMLDTLDLRRDALAEELRARLAIAEREAQDAETRLAEIEARVGEIHEGTELTRVRMRIERIGHTLTTLDGRLSALEESQSVERHAKIEKRIDRLESLFEELIDELKQREESSDVDAIRSRLDDVERLVLDAGSAVEAQKREIRRISDTMAPPAPEGDDLTRVKGIGPKYAEGLRSMGVTRLEHIAGWSVADVERVAAFLKIKPSRILNAGWVESAAKLAKKD